MGDTRLREVGLCFLKLGTIAFGGPAAHLSLMRSELVRRRGWVDEQEFLDLMGGASLLPGPTSTEVAIMLAKRRAGWPGLVVGGVAFIAPAMVMVLGLSWAYVRYGSTGPGAHILEGVLPVIIAIIAEAVVGLARQGLRSWLKAAIALGALATYALGLNPVLVLVGGLVTALGVRELARRRAWRFELAASPALWAVFLEFLKLGAVVFGSGYVLFAYLRADLVGSHHWLTLHQLLAAAAIGQLTPGPVFTTVTSVGYLVAGVPGALLATVGVFLPSFLLVAATLPLIARVRRSLRGRAALDGLTAAALALVVGVTAQLAGDALVSWWTALEGAVALALLLRFRPNPTWLILGGIAVGLLATVR